MDQAQVRLALERITDLIDLIQEHSDRTSPKFELHLAEGYFHELKEHVRAEYDRMKTVRGQAALSEAESAWYWPAVQEAWANSLSPARFGRDGKWRSYVIDAEDQIRWYISNLKDAASV